uniref:Uncharacterized protein n=1 Tax=Panagrolaimus sp. ES5 TaxID=591445 RepID=A0AC34G3N8_9BILA
ISKMSDLNVIRRDSKYKCFWDFLHVKTGTYVICGVALIGFLLSIIGVFQEDFTSYKPYFHLIGVLIGILAYVGVLVGIYQSKPQYFYLCLWRLVIQIVVFTFISIFWVIYVAVCILSPHAFDMNERVEGIQYSILCVGLLLLNIFIFNVIYKCYKYVKDGAAADKDVLPQSNVTQISVTSEREIHL